MQGIDISEVLTVLLAVAGAITAFGGAWAVIDKAKSSSKSKLNSDDIQVIKTQIGDLDIRVKTLEKANKDQDKFVNAMCETMLAMLDHEITGNSVDKLKKARDEMNEYIIHRGEG